ncbi:MAG: HAMP domain-containing sensor histidine kinase [Actinomycetota bacterium]
MLRRLWGRLGLRARITGLYAAGGLLLSLAIALSTLTLARQNLVEDREERSFEVMRRNARLVQERLGPDSTIEGVGVIFESLTITDRSAPLLRIGNGWEGDKPLVFNEALVPPSLLQQVEAGDPARMRVSLDGEPTIVYGIPLPNLDADYYEAVASDDVEATLRALGIIVMGVAAAATLLSAALGSWAARRALTPLGEVRAAAESLAAGELDTRLDPPADADLASLTASFNGMARSLEDRIERDARFASEVSHELRSPLMTLNASIEVLNNSRRDMPERSQTALDLLTDDVARFTVLVEDLLEISRYDVGTARLHAEAIDLVEFVRQTVRHSPYTVELRSPKLDHLVVAGDKRRLAQVVSNLIDNAAKYGAGRIEVVVDRVGQAARIAVEDEGAGVPEAERSIIFDRFSRGSAGGRRGQGTGSGLGLALIAEHVGLHGGTIWVEDRPDGRSGARFVAQIPVGDLHALDLGEGDLA